MELATLTKFFGWMALINIGILLFSAFILTVFKNPILGMHSRMFNIDREDLKKMYIDFLAQYKILMFIFTIVPYFALRIVV